MNKKEYIRFAHALPVKYLESLAPNVCRCLGQVGKEKKKKERNIGRKKRKSRKKGEEMEKARKKDEV